MPSTLLLFDLDGTLITTRAGRRAFNAAFQRLFGLDEAAGTVPMAGRTDPAIFREVCQHHQLNTQAFEAWKGSFLEALAIAMKEDPGCTLPGVTELLELCSREPGFWLALGTGNIEEGARLKLSPHRLNGYFPTGGFGADGTTRDEVIARGICRAKAYYGQSFDHVVVIGDTPDDILCGRANQCLSVAVATGPYSAADLAACGPDMVLPDFSCPGEVLRQFRELCA